MKFWIVTVVPKYMPEGKMMYYEDVLHQCTCQRILYYKTLSLEIWKRLLKVAKCNRSWEVIRNVQEPCPYSIHREICLCSQDEHLERYMLRGWLEWPRSLRHKQQTMFTAWTLGFWARIQLEAWMCAFAPCLCSPASLLRPSECLSDSYYSYRLCTGWRVWQSCQGPIKGL
jgi:hypothetical protein